MTVTTITEPEVQPDLGEAPPCWPPLAHLIRKEDEPVKEGSIALCGTKLMGIDLGRVRNAGANVKICEKCRQVFERELGL